MKLKTILILLFFSFFCINAQASYEKSVVKISSTVSLYDYKYPWKDAKRKDITGSGVIIKEQYILTAAHVVSNAKTVEIEKSNESKKYYAKIKYISHQADLALLEVYDKNFFENTEVLNISTKFKNKDEIIVAGYPFGENKLSSKKGNISKLEYYSYALSNEKLLALNMDISLNHGNSGGPILNKNGHIVGIAMQKNKNSDDTAYAISSFIINTFFTDIKDGKVDGFHSNSNDYQYLQNQTLREYYKVQEYGILVTHTDIREKQLKVNVVN